MKPTVKKLLCFLLCTLLISALLTFTASADFGPKPSVRIRFSNMKNAPCYGTLLSKYPSTGPNSAWDGNEEHIYNDNLDLDIWRAFVAYEDTDGYYFLQIAWDVSQTGEIAWTYYPPDSFKILLYYPETGEYAVSGICERYAFDTYYSVDMEGVAIGSVHYDEELSGNDRLTAHKAYEWKQEALSLAARILITIAIEMAVAYLFGFRGKSALLFLVLVNTLTQVILNVLLNVINFSSGQAAFVTGYILLELLVVVMEAVLYTFLMKRYTDAAKTPRFYAVYALVANAVSFGAGLAVAHLLPGIF